MGAPLAWLESSPTRWYLVFCDAQGRGWWDRAFHTRPGFSHVYALRWDGYNWIYFNPAVTFTDIAIQPGTTENALQGLIEPGGTVVEVEAFRRTDRIRGRWWVGPMTCVEQIKALIGLPVGRIWTPWQLYRYLIEAPPDGNIQETKNPGAHASVERTGAPATIRSRRAYQGRERTLKGHQTWQAR